MNTNVKHRLDADTSASSIKNIFTVGVNGGSNPRRTLQAIQPTVTTGYLVGRTREPVRSLPKRKLWSTEQPKSSKRAKTEVAVYTEDNENENGPEGMTKETYELMVKETPPSIYWKELADERREALYKVLQENEMLHKKIELKEENISKLKQENEELAELAEHVQYMASMIERLTGKSPDNLKVLRDLDAEEQEHEHEHEDDEEYISSEDEDEDDKLSEFESDNEDDTTVPDFNVPKSSLN
ncbi:geminin-like [Acipenser oxyrinchus oxyrinchus]|uniref:Geminin-like n=1 Tax=Acipenser oxyrinchus oxyrinchus TaxID=40147 RepID=A0AAD8LQX9_ACIOX|nr:geminin-like [Acipenser oxyrinchus oxyrinchus]